MTAARRVVVAHDNETIRGVISSLLARAGFSVDAVPDGTTCVPALEGDGVAALVLDVAVSGTFVMDVIEAAKKRALPVVLVASIYNRTSYKRRPTSLYGADDYVEQHHIPDSLVPKVMALLGATPALASVVTAESTEEVRVAGEHQLDKQAPGPEAIERATRLARLIVSDIALYNGDAVVAAREHGTEELEARLRLDLEEGRLLFDLRVPVAVRRVRDFIAEALRELVAQAKVT